MSLNPDNEFCFLFIFIVRFQHDSYKMLEHGHLLNISCKKVFDICKIKRMVTSLMNLGYVNNYDKKSLSRKISESRCIAISIIIFIALRKRLMTLIFGK